MLLDAGHKTARIVKSAMAQVLVIMGVSGSGKSTVGQALASRLNCLYYEGDDFHPPQNVAKMRSGEPLDDEDRAPWLSRLAELVSDLLTRGDTAVIACSALKKRYRDQLRVSDEVKFVYLEGNFDLIWLRMQNRADHYMKAEMLRSQFDDLEIPAAREALKVPIDQDVKSIVNSIELALVRRARPGAQ